VARLIRPGLAAHGFRNAPGGKSVRGFIRAALLAAEIYGRFAVKRIITRMYACMRATPCSGMKLRARESRLNLISDQLVA
jgi:hypothetical protein